MLLKNPAGESPRISASAYVCESAVITGNVIIGGRVFIAPHASVRADEPGSAIIIGNGCNIQDNVIVHALTNTKAVIGDQTSLSHGCIVHGPIEVGKNCFIGFGAVIFDCSIGDSSFVSHRALVRGVNIASRKVVKDGAVVVGQIEADRLEVVTVEHTEFASSVARTNIMLAESYQMIKK
ncbi:MAG: carbonate dehydratase [Candidatus Methanoperedens sp.]|nr:carbonate dehydratase [Candidatus Methanoperedens sp.]